MKASDLFVLPTREDIWGLVINEAMTQGLPVITTDNCMAGLEMIKDKNCIVPVGNSVKLSESINYLLSDPEQLKKIGENNLNTIKEYSIEKMAFAHFNHLN
jgi:glycosyltransferase involved in cell wall biosynthesis